MGGRRAEVFANTDGLRQDVAEFVPCDARTAAFELSGNGGPVKLGLIALPAT